jgi:hypothetical protein
MGFDLNKQSTYSLFDHLLMDPFLLALATYYTVFDDLAACHE